MQPRVDGRLLGFPFNPNPVRQVIAAPCVLQLHSDLCANGTLVNMHMSSIANGWMERSQIALMPLFRPGLGSRVGI